MGMTRMAGVMALLAVPNAKAIDAVQAAWDSLITSRAVLAHIMLYAGVSLETESEHILPSSE